jgi:hypothetical protein
MRKDSEDVGRVRTGGLDKGCEVKACFGIEILH